MNNLVVSIAMGFNPWNYKIYYNANWILTQNITQ